MIVGAAVAVLVLLVMAHSSYFVAVDAVDAVGGVLELAGPVGRSCRCDFQELPRFIAVVVFYRHVFSCSS